VIDVRAQVAALPASGGTVGFYSWDAAGHEGNVRELQRAAYQRRLVVIGFGGSHGRWHARLAPQSEARIRCCSGTRGAGRKRARRSRQRVGRIMEAYRYRDRLVPRIGWARAVKDPLFLEMLSRLTRPRGKSR
jgi:hypothetical protein